MTETRPLKEATYESVTIPQEFGPGKLTVNDHKIKTFAFTQDDYHRWHFGRSPFGARIGHAAILAQDLLLLFTMVYDHNTVIGLHAEEELWFTNPAFADEIVTLHGRYVDKYERRCNGYVVMEGEAYGQDGRLLLRHRGIELVRITSATSVGRGTAAVVGDRVSGEYRSDLKPVLRARLGLVPGTPLASLIKRTTAEQTSVFSAAGKYVRTIHTDPKRARTAGFPAPVVQGQQQACYLAELMTRFFGHSWFTSGWMKLKFIYPLIVGQTAIAGGVIRGAEPTNDGSAKLKVEVWVRNGEGQLVTVGWASAAVDEAEASSARGLRTDSVDRRIGRQGTGG